MFDRESELQIMIYKEAKNRQREIYRERKGGISIEQRESMPKMRKMGECTYGRCESNINEPAAQMTQLTTAEVRKREREKRKIEVKERITQKKRRKGKRQPENSTTKC